MFLECCRKSSDEGLRLLDASILVAWGLGRGHVDPWGDVTVEMTPEEWGWLTSQGVGQREFCVASVACAKGLWGSVRGKRRSEVWHGMEWVPGLYQQPAKMCFVIIWGENRHQGNGEGALESSQHPNIKNWHYTLLIQTFRLANSHLISSASLRRKPRECYSTLAQGVITLNFCKE